MSFMSFFKYIKDLLTPASWKEHALRESYGERARRIVSLADGCRSQYLHWKVTDSITDLGRWANYVHGCVVQDNRFELWPEFSREYLDPLDRWLSDFATLCRSNTELSKEALQTSVQTMAPRFNKRFVDYIAQYHALDLEALKTADTEVSTADPRLRIVLEKRPKAWELRDSLTKLSQPVTNFYNRAHYDFASCLSKDELDMVYSIMTMLTQCRNSIIDTESWDAVKPFESYYVKPIANAFATYQRLATRKVVEAVPVIADFNVRVLPLFRDSLVAFHNQLHVDQIAQLQTTEAELSIVMAPVASAAARADAVAEAHAE